MATHQTNDFIILGPSMGSGGKVLDAVHALYFLPDNFKLILTGRHTVDQSFLDELEALIDRNDLGKRVQFDSDVEVNAIVLPNPGMSRTRNSITGNSPEALASAILHLARSRV